jgi:hypothetical protein
MPFLCALCFDQGRRLSGTAHAAHELSHERQRRLREKTTMIQYFHRRSL